MTNLPLQKPVVLSYLSIQHFLDDLYKYRKATEPEFSYELWSQELGIANRSYLRQLVIGRRHVNAKMTELLSERLYLQGTEKDYLKVLVLYSQSRSQEQRNIYGRELMQLLKSSYPQGEIQDAYDFVATPLIPKLLILLNFPDIPKTPPALAVRLKCSVAQLTESLAVLERLGMAQQDRATSEWTALQKSFKVPDQLGNVALQEYHRQSLEEAIQAQKLPPAQRRYKSLLLPLNDQDFSTFLEDLQVFVKQSLQKFDCDDMGARRLHQVNFNIYPVSENP